MGHANDRIHGRANLMAHIGQKITFGLVGLDRGVFGIDEFILHLLAFSNVGKHAKGADFITVGIKKRRGVDQAGNNATIRSIY